MGMTTGVVKDASGNPLGGVAVDFNKVGGATATATTDANGNYAIFLSPGTYNADIGGDVCDPSSFNIPTGTKLQNLTK